MAFWNRIRNRPPAADPAADTPADEHDPTGPTRMTRQPGAGNDPALQAPGAGRRLFEKDNQGVRVRRLEQAEPYRAWQEQGFEAPPYLLYRFRREVDAAEAMWSLPCLHPAQDTGHPVCTLALVFGWYRRGDGQWEALLGGPPLNADLWQLARGCFESSGGRPVNHRRPDRRFPAAGAPYADITLIHEYTDVGLTGNRRVLVYRAPDPTTARTFLLRRDQRVDDPSLVIRIETPAGVLGRDADGIFDENGRYRGQPR